MKKLFLCLMACFLSVILFSGNIVWADERDEEIGVLKTQVQELMKRIEKLEAEQQEAKKTLDEQKKDLTKRVDLANVTSKLKMKGRAALGFFDSGKAGSYPSGSFEVPDAKIQFAFEPDKFNTVVMRFNLNNATAQTPLLDYFYLQSKDFLPFLKDTPFSLGSRLGRFKLGFGEETWSDNPVESVLPSKSAAGASVIDEGLEFAGKVKLDKIGLKPLGWVTSISDGNSGVGSDSGAAKAFMGKLYYTPIDQFYLSASYYDSESLKSSSAEMSIAGLTSRPSGATNWERKVWEVDARYDFGKGKKPLDPPAYSDSKAYVKLAYGEFEDDAVSVAGRKGDYGFIEGAYNLTPKLYGALRYSMIDLDGSTTASLNSVTANEYQRYSIGGGYRFSENTIFKVSYDINEEKGTITDDAPNNDLISAIVATQF